MSILTPFPFLYASEEPAGVVKPSPAMDRMCFPPRDVKGVGLGVLAGGERVLVTGKFLICLRWA